MFWRSHRETLEVLVFSSIGVRFSESRHWTGTKEKEGGDRKDSLLTKFKGFIHSDNSEVREKVRREVDFTGVNGRGE